MNSESIATRRLQNGLEEFEQFVDWFTQANDDDAYEVHSRIVRLGTMGPRKFVYLFHDLLELHSPGPKDRRVLEKAAKHMVRKRIRVSRDSYRNEVTLLKTFLATAKSVSRGKRKAASEHVAAGSFKLINMGGFPDKTMKAVAVLVKEAEDKLRKLGMESVIYGEIKVVNTIMGTAVAHYWPITDEVYVRANIRKGVGVESIIHELAHRFHYKNPDSKTVIEALYRATKRRQENVLDDAITDRSNWPKMGELIGKPPALGELESRWQVVGFSYGRGPRVELKRFDSDQKGQVSLRGYLEMEGKVPKIFVSRYAMTNATENFAEMTAKYAVGKVNEEQRQVFEQVLGRLGVVPKANPTGSTWREYIRGEWWIDSDGESTFADQDVGDYGHEVIAFDNMVSTDTLLEELANWYRSQEPLSEGWGREDADDYADEILSMQDTEMSASDLVFGRGEYIPDTVGVKAVGSKDKWEAIRKDPRLAYAKYEGAIMVVDLNFSAYRVTEKTISAIQSFIRERANWEDIDDDDTVIWIEQSEPGKHANMPVKEFLLIRKPRELWIGTGIRNNPVHNRNCPNCGERIDLKNRYVALFDDELFCNVECAKNYRYANEEEGPIFNFHGANENPTNANREIEKLSVDAEAWFDLASRVGSNNPRYMEFIGRANEAVERIRALEIASGKKWETMREIA